MLFLLQLASCVVNVFCSVVSWFDSMYDFRAQYREPEVEVKFGIKVIHKCYQKCTRSRAKRLERPALVHLLYVYV